MPVSIVPVKAEFIVLIVMETDANESGFNIDAMVNEMLVPAAFEDEKPFLIVRVSVDVE